MTYIRIWKIPVFLAAFASSNFAHSAGATLNKTATPSRLKSNLLNQLGQGATPPQSDYQSSNNFNEELTNGTKISTKASELLDNWQQFGKTEIASQYVSFPELISDIQPFVVQDFELDDVPHSAKTRYVLAEKEPSKNTDSQTDQLIAAENEPSKNTDSQIDQLIAAENEPSKNTDSQTDQLIAAENEPSKNTDSQIDQLIAAENEPPKNTDSGKDEVDDLRQRFHLPSIPFKSNPNPAEIISTPGSSIASPVAFGAAFRDVFLGVSYQTRTRYTNTNDGGVVFGFGLGDRQVVGLEVAISSFSTVYEGLFTNGGISLKLHHLFPNEFAIAFGIEDAATFGSPDAGSSIYGVASKVFILKKDVTKPFSSITVSLGLGGGRFRSEYDVQKGIESVNVFGSVGLRIVEPISLIADWTGEDLTMGVSIAPFRKIPIVITPAVADITGNAGDGARFVLGAGFGYSF